MTTCVVNFFVCWCCCCLLLTAILSFFCWRRRFRVHYDNFFLLNWSAASNSFPTCKPSNNFSFFVLKNMISNFWHYYIQQAYMLCMKDKRKQLNSFFLFLCSPLNSFRAWKYEKFFPFASSCVNKYFCFIVFSVPAY